MTMPNNSDSKMLRICGLVVEFIVAIDETRVRFPADALLLCSRVPVLIPSNAQPEIEEICKGARIGHHFFRFNLLRCCVLIP